MHQLANTDAPPGEAVPVRPSAKIISKRALCVLVLIAAFLSIAVQMCFLPMVGMGTGFESLSVAKSLAIKGTFADPFDGPTGPTAHLAPLWPFMLAGIYRAAGNEEYFRVTALLLAVLMHVLNVLLLFLLAGELFGDSLSQICTLGLALFVPLYQVIPAGEAIYVSAGLLGFWLLARRHKVVLCGLLGGLLLLFSPLLLLVLAPIATYEWKTVRKVSAFLVIMLLVILPWQVRNYEVFHKVFFVRDNLGLELDLYNNDCEVSGTRGCAPHPIYSAVERAKVAEMGEMAYNDMRMKHAVTWFRGHPGTAARLIARRIVAYWFPVSAAPPYGYAFAFVTAVSLLGFWRLWRNRLTVVWPMLAIMAVYPLVYYLVRLDLRYRHSILWISILVAGYGIGRIIELSGLKQKPPYDSASFRKT